METGNSIYDSRNGCNAIIRTSDNTLISGCDNTTIPATVASIGERALDDFTNIKSITIPSSVTNIASHAFAGCKNLQDIYCEGTTPPAYSRGSVFYYEICPTCTIHVPEGYLGAYRASSWNEFTSIQEYDATKVNAVNDNVNKTEQRIYNLSGVRMSAPQKGVNIINGKKVVF